MRKTIRRVLVCGIVAGMALCIPGCAENAGGNSVNAAEAESAAENPSEEKLPPQENEKEEEEETFELVGIKAHVKEIHGNELLISSDSDDFPGVFTVTGEKQSSEFADLEGGTSILILMRKLGEKGEQYDKYEAEQIVIIPDGEEAHADILLTEAPEFILQDALSSQMASVSLKSGNYGWNVVENGEGSGIVACGAAPLDEASMDFTVKLKIPKYSGMDCVPYSFSTTIAPDLLTVRRWNADDAGNSGAGEEAITRYYYRQPILELEAGKVYEFAAEWKEENKDKNGFYGYASYVLVTQ